MRELFLRQAWTSVGLEEPTVMEEHETPDRNRWKRRRGTTLGYGQVA
jgi:hypothetical protein